MNKFGKEIEYVEKYKSDSRFNFLEADRTQIVYRSEVSSHTTDSHPFLVPAIGIILVGAMYFELLTHFNKLSISKPNDKKSLELA